MIINYCRKTIFHNGLYDIELNKALIKSKLSSQNNKNFGLSSFNIRFRNEIHKQLLTTDRGKSNLEEIVIHMKEVK